MPHAFPCASFVICCDAQPCTMVLNVIYCAEPSSGAEPLLMHLPQNPHANHGQAQSCTMPSNMVCCAECLRSCQLSACAHQRRRICVFWGVRSLCAGTTYAHGPARTVATGTAGPGSHQPRLAPVIVKPVVTCAHTLARMHTHMHITSQDMYIPSQDMHSTSQDMHTTSFKRISSQEMKQQ